MVTLVVETTGQRLDVFLTERLECTRSCIRNLICNGYVQVDKQTVKAGYTLKAGQSVTAIIPEPIVAEIIPENIDFGVIYEDEHIAVIDKPQGLTVHPAVGISTNTLVNGLMSRISDLSSINGVVRPGIVHRLDKNTSGLMVIAKTNEAHIKLSADISARKVTKKYIALLEGVVLQDNETIITNISRDSKERKRMAVTSSGKQAVTRYNVLKRFEKHSLVEFDILTGRTHQIRVHAKYIGHPIAGDTTYGYKKQTIGGLKGQLLHAYKLGFKHPANGEQVEFKAKIPQYFREVIIKYGNCKATSIGL